MTRRHPRRPRTGLIVAGLMAAALHQAAAAGDLSSLLSQHRLVLVYRARDDELARAVLPYLQDFAAVYGHEGLAVAVIGMPAEASDSRSGQPLLRLQNDRGFADEAELVVYGRDGTATLAMERAAIDLYAVYRACERALRGRARVTLSEHVRQLIESRIAAGSRVISDEELDDILIEDLLRRYPDGCLLLPPGCSDCMLEKNAAVLGDLFAQRADIPLIAFDRGVAEHLRRLGWAGTPYVLPSDPESRLLSLRQGGNYQPLLVWRRGSNGLEVRPVRSGGAP